MTAHPGGNWNYNTVPPWGGQGGEGGGEGQRGGSRCFPGSSSCSILTTLPQPRQAHVGDPGAGSEDTPRSRCEPVLGGKRKGGH